MGGEGAGGSGRHGLQRRPLRVPAGGEHPQAVPQEQARGPPHGVPLSPPLGFKHLRLHASHDLDLGGTADSRMSQEPLSPLQHTTPPFPALISSFSSFNIPIPLILFLSPSPSEHRNPHSLSPRIRQK